MRQEPSNHGWEEREAERDEAERKAEELKELEVHIKKILIETENSWIIRNLQPVIANLSPRVYIEEAILANQTPRFDYLAAKSKTSEIINEWTEIQEEKYRLADMAAAKQEYDAATPAERAKVLGEEDEDECPHDEHDHGICLDCGKDIWDDVVAAAEFRADSLEDR